MKHDNFTGEVGESDIFMTYNIITMFWKRRQNMAYH